MATFLELAQDVARQSGSFEPTQLASVVGQTGRAAKIVDLVQKAYRNLQNSRRDWGWLVTTFTQSLIPGNAVYTPASFGITRFSSWMTQLDWFQSVTLYDPALGVKDEGELRQISYELWKMRFDRGDQSNQQRPTEFAISPLNEMVFGPIPDKAYTVRGRYQKGPQTLAVNTDIPEMPVRFHDLIMWEATRLLQIHDGAFDETQYSSLETVGLRHQLEIDQLPEIAIP